MGAPEETALPDVPLFTVKGLWDALPLDLFLQVCAAMPLGLLGRGRMSKLFLFLSCFGVLPVQLRVLHEQRYSCGCHESWLHVHAA